MRQPALRCLNPDQGATVDAVQALVRSYFDEVWRLLRRLGLPEADADDAAQQVFIVAGRRITSVETGRERAFLYGCALNYAAKWRQSRHACAQLTATGELESLNRADESVPPLDELVERHRARRLLDGMLDRMPDDLRVVFVLFELEEQSLQEIAGLLDIPRGTAASRLRRAREDFAKRLSRLERQLRLRGGARWGILTGYCENPRVSSRASCCKRARTKGRQSKCGAERAKRWGRRWAPQRRARPRPLPE